MISLAAQRVLTLVCSDCHAGWYSTTSLSCSRCGRRGEVRGMHVEVPLPPARASQSTT